MTLRKNQARALSGTAGAGALRKESQNNVEKVPWAAGADSNLQRLYELGQSRSRGEVTGSAHESVRAMKEGQRPPRKRYTFLHWKVTPTVGKGTLGTWSFH
jgi:hypothetical protein